MTDYDTKFEDGKWTCTCPHFKYKNTPCRHILEKMLEIRGNTVGVRDTSLDAYIEIINDPQKMNDRYQEILMAIDEIGHGATDYEIAKHLGKNDPNYVRPRRNELVNKFYKAFVIETGKKECKVSHKMAFAWDLTQQGKMLVSAMYHIRLA